MTPLLYVSCIRILACVPALLLISRSWLHQLVRDRLTEREALDAVLLAAVALIALPLLPDRTLDRWGALNPQLIGRLTVVVLLINAVGYVALRVFGARIGLPVTGFLGGFVSSTATIASLGKRARTGLRAARGRWRRSVVRADSAAASGHIVRHKLRPFGAALVCAGRRRRRRCCLRKLVPVARQHCA